MNKGVISAVAQTVWVGELYTCRPTRFYKVPAV